MAQQTAEQTSQHTFRNVVDGESIDSASGEAPSGARLLLLLSKR